MTPPATSSISDVEAYVRRNLVVADRSRVECGDGRYTPAQSRGAVRALGGDFGMVLAFASAAREAGAAPGSGGLVTAYLDAVTPERGAGARLYIHTDDDGQRSGGIGCRHAALASSPANEGRYGELTSGEVRDLVQAMRSHPSAHLTVLGGRHAEAALLLVHSGDERDPGSSVHSSDGTGRSFLVVDVAGSQRHVARFVPRMSHALGSKISPAQVWQRYEAQQWATAGLVMGGLDVFQVKIDGFWIGCARKTPVLATHGAGGGG